uniref:Uncharacterized protein n=1 Tax=Arundo donax TaxID=35708 RepID=A0A0A9AA23_ARUDO
MLSSCMVFPPSTVRSDRSVVCPTSIVGSQNDRSAPSAPLCAPEPLCALPIVQHCANPITPPARPTTGSSTHISAMAAVGSSTHGRSD